MLFPLVLLVSVTLAAAGSDHAIDCIHGEGLEYRGPLNVTASGKACQPWDSQLPHPHTYADKVDSDAGNACRNPSGDDQPWCYTTSILKRWEYCELPQCSDAYEYESFADLVDFASAKADCKARGGSLALPRSVGEEAEILAEVVENADINFTTTAFPDYQFFWLNIEENEDNSPTTELSFTNYMDGQPNRPTENCIGAALARGGVWADRPCDDLSPYVCQYTHVDLGCWKLLGKKKNKLVKLEGKNSVLDKKKYKKRTEHVRKCEVAAREAGYDFFALVNGGQCWAGHGEDYITKDMSHKCKDHGLGARKVANVYGLLY